MRTTPTGQRPSGIKPIGELPWGSRFCVFYASQRELLDALVPFIRTGLECNELCSWEVQAPLTIEEVTSELTRAVPDFARYVALGQVEIVPPPEDAARRPKADEALERRLDRAILAGFDGLRAVCHGDGSAEGQGLAAAVDGLGRLNVIAAFPYPRAQLGVADLLERVQEHPFALVCNAGRWEVLRGSEARSAHTALQRSEEKLQSLFRNMSEGFAYHRVVLDARGRPCDYVFLEVNPAFERLTGLVAQEIIGKRVTQVFPGIEADPTDWIGKYGRVALTGEPIRFESHAAALDRWYAVSAFSSRKGYFAVSFAEISDRKRAEAERRAAEERLLVTLRSIGDAVISTDTAGRAVMLNRVAEELTGFTQAEAAGKPLREVFNIIHEETGEPAEDPVRKVIECGTVIGLANHTALVRRDGHRISIADSAAPVRNDSGELLGVVLVFRDVTHERQAERKLAMEAIERVQAQQALHEANQRLQEADRRKDEFLAVLSHELRNPLAPIQNSLYILDHAVPGGEQASRSLEVIRRQAIHLARLVDDLLDVTRIARGKIRLQRQRVDLVDVVRRTVDDYRPSFSESGVRLDVRLPDAALWADADATRLAQVVGNLLGNALKFTPRDADVELKLREEHGWAVLRVRDSGLGIAPDMIERLFTPFSQAEQTLDRSRGGLGLGLALVRGLAELHGGSASAASDGLGRGSTFTVRLPIERAPQTVEPAPRRPRAVQHRVLVIEDNVDSADSLKELLEIWGHEVKVAYDGPAGIAVAREFRPHLVLCDIGLPEMSGHEVARAFRADAALKTTYLVALSGYALPDDVQRAIESGFERHLAKPLGIQALEELFAERELEGEGSLSA